MPAKFDDGPVGEEGRNDPVAAGELFDESLLVDGAIDVADMLATLRQGFVTQFRFDGPCGPNSIAWMYANAAAAIRCLAAERDQWKADAERAVAMVGHLGGEVSVLTAERDRLHTAYAQALGEISVLEARLETAGDDQGHGTSGPRM